MTGSSAPKFMTTCFTCGRAFQFGPHLYAGKHVPRYSITVCRDCYDANWDGWAPQFEAKILAHLEKNNLPAPIRNTDGLLPRD